MQISSSTPSIQMLKAQQAWEARKSRPAAPQEAPQSNAPVASIETNKPELPPASGTSALPQWGKTVQEIQHIAQKSGFVGVSEQDIRRAYTYGESLLADYRV